MVMLLALWTTWSHFVFWHARWIETPKIKEWTVLEPLTFVLHSIAVAFVGGCSVAFYDLTRDPNEANAANMTYFFVGLILSRVTLILKQCQALWATSSDRIYIIWAIAVHTVSMGYLAYMYVIYSADNL